MLIVMMLAGGTPPVGGFPTLKSLAVADGALPETRMGQGRAQQRKQQAENEKYPASEKHDVSIHSRLHPPIDSAGGGTGAVRIAPS
jgi:hypothetical protein